MVNLFYVGVGALLVVAAGYDVFRKGVPQQLLWLLLLVLMGSSILWQLPQNPSDLVIGALVLGALVGFWYWMARGKGVGLADVYVSVAIGMMFGWLKGLLVFAIGNFLGLLLMVPCSMLLHKRGFKTIPLVCFLVLAIFIEWGFSLSDLLLSYILLI